MHNYSNTKVTLELRDVLASTDANGNPFDLWDFDYPCFYEGDEKKAFEQRIIDHYYFHQIGVETIARFKHNFRTRIREIMPYYNQFYESEKYMKEIDDPFATVDYTETFEQTSTDESTGTATTTATGDETVNALKKESDTPQGSISNLDSYLSRAEQNDQQTNANSQTDTETTGSNTGTIKHTLTKKGAMGVTTFGHDMIEYRQSFINVDMMVIGALKDLFLLVY